MVQGVTQDMRLDQVDNGGQLGGKWGNSGLMIDRVQ